MRAHRRYSHILSRGFEQNANADLLQCKNLPVYKKRQGKYYDLAPYATVHHRRLEYQNLNVKELPLLLLSVRNIALSINRFPQ